MKHAAGFNGPDGGKDENGKKLRPWLQDYMQHTAISMDVSKHKNEGKAATGACNSPNVIHRYYKGLLKESDATKFWKLTPATSQGEVVTFTGRAAA